MRGIPQAEPPQAGADVPTGAWLFLPNFFTLEITPRSVPGSPEGVLNSLWRSGNAPDRYPAFFAKLFSLGKSPTGSPGESGGGTQPPLAVGQRRNRYPTFFAKLFFTWEITHGQSGGVQRGYPTPSVM